MADNDLTSGTSFIVCTYCNSENVVVDRNKPPKFCTECGEGLAPLPSGATNNAKAVDESEEKLNKSPSENNYNGNVLTNGFSLDDKPSSEKCKTLSDKPSDDEMSNTKPPDQPPSDKPTDNDSDKLPDSDKPTTNKPPDNDKPPSDKPLDDGNPPNDKPPDNGSLPSDKPLDDHELLSSKPSDNDQLPDDSPPSPLDDDSSITKPPSGRLSDNEPCGHRLYGTESPDNADEAEKVYIKCSIIDVTSAIVIILLYSTSKHEMVCHYTVVIFTIISQRVKIQCVKCVTVVMQLS